MEERTCLICLDGPQEENPIYLLSCGCKISWFHRSCQMNWMSHLHSQYPLRCPTCKREVPMHLHYAFDPSFGLQQRKLRMITFLGAAESFLAISLWSQYYFETNLQLPETLLIPIQSLLLLYLPLMIHSEYDTITAMKHVYYKNGIQVIYLVFYYFRRGFYNIYSLPNHITFLVFIGFLHTLIFGAQILESRYARRIQPINPLTPFLIGGDTIYADVLTVVKTTTDSTKVNTTSVRRSTRLAGI
jgi:hypothetical protein